MPTRSTRAAVQLDDAFVAAADVENVGKTAVLLLKRNRCVTVYGLARACRTDDEHDAHAVHIHVLKERRPRARLEDVEVFGIEVVRVRMPDMRREHGGQPRVMILRQPQREDVELVIAGEHRVEA